MPSGSWRFETTILKNKSASDLAQVPAAATINFYRQGASVSQAVTVPVTVNDPDPQPTTVSVYDSGSLKVGDTLHARGDATLLLNVVELVSRTSVKVLNMTQNSIALAVADRLITIGSPRPIAYKDPLGTVSMGSSLATDPATGRAGAYFREPIIDYVVTGTGLTARAYVDVEGERPSGWVAVSPTLGIQAAIDALPPAGGPVYIPSGTHTISSTIVIPKDKRVHLIGDGADRTVIYCASASVDILRIKGGFTTIENLTVKGPNTAGAGRGIVLGTLSADNPTDQLRRVAIIGCRVLQTASSALYLIGNDPTQDPQPHPDYSLGLWGHFERSEFRENKSGPLARIGPGNTTQTFINCNFCFFVNEGLIVEDALGLSLLSSTFEDKRDDLKSYLVLNGVRSALVSMCWFEQHLAANELFPGHPGDVTQPFILIGPTKQCRDLSILNPLFARNITGTYPRLIRVGSSSKSISMSDPSCALNEAIAMDRFSDPEPTKKDIHVEEGSEFYLRGGLISDSALFTRPLALTSTSGLAIVGTGPRITPPKVTTAQRDDPNSLAFDPKDGALVFNSDVGRAEVRIGTKWQQVPGRAGAASFDSNISMPAPVAIVSNGAAGVYRVSIYLEKLSPGGGGPSVVITWTDDAGQRTRTLAISDAGSNVFASDTFSLYLAAGQSILYQVFTTSQLYQTRARLRAEEI